MKYLLDGVGFVHVFSVVLVGCSVLILGSEHFQRRRLSRLTIASGLTTLSLVMVVAVLISMFWDVVFVLFHQLLFKPETWQFGPESMLIRMFPEIFWVNSAVTVVVLTAVEATVLAILPSLAGWLEKR